MKLHMVVVSITLFDDVIGNFNILQKLLFMLIIETFLKDFLEILNSPLQIS